MVFCFKSVLWMLTLYFNISFKFVAQSREETTLGHFLPCNPCPWPSLGQCPRGLGGGSLHCRSSTPPQQGSAPSSLRYHSTGFHFEELRKEKKLWKEAIEHQHLFATIPEDFNLKNWGEKTLKRSHWAPSSLRYHSRGFQLEKLGRKILWIEAIEHHHLFATIPEDFRLKN